MITREWVTFYLPSGGWAIIVMGDWWSIGRIQGVPEKDMNDRILNWADWSLKTNQTPMDDITAMERINWKMADWMMGVAQKIVGVGSNLSSPIAIIQCKIPQQTTSLTVTS